MADQQQQPEQPPQVPRFSTPFNFGITRDDGSSVPLKNVTVDVAILDFLAEVSIEQRFENPKEAKEAIEAVYRFPLDAEAVLRAFSVRLDDGTVVQGRVQEKQQAAETYDDALAGGHGGFLLQEDNDMKDVFSLRVGNLPPGAAATVCLSYVAQIDEEEGEEGDGGAPRSLLRFVLPTAVAPRYAPASDTPPELYQHAEALLAQWPKDLLKIKGTVTAASPILGLVPHTFQEEAALELGGGNTAAFSLTAAHLDQDFVLGIQLQGRLPDRAWVDRATGAATVAAGLRPGQLKTGDEDADEAAAAAGEYVFVIDRSGSMEGGSILQAREALALCVSALPLGARFQIVGFGSTFTQLFPDGAAAFDDARKAEALAHCQALQADMGGTEILPALQAVAAAGSGNHDGASARPRQVFVITDGQVCNTGGVLAFVRGDHEKQGTRYFALGIGAGASRALVKGIAEKGGGASAFVVEGERLQRKVMAQMNRALEPGLADARVMLAPPLRLAEGSEGFAPKKPRPLFAGARLLAFGSLDPASLAGLDDEAAAGQEGGLIAVAGKAASGSNKSEEEEKEVRLPVPVRFVAGEREGRMLQALATRAALRDLEAEAEGAEGSEAAEAVAAAAKAKAVALSEARGVMCKWTAFVAVAERADAATGALKPVHIPLAFVNRENQGDPWSYMQRQAMHHPGMHTGYAAPMMAMACGAAPPPMAMAMAMPCSVAAMPPMAPAPRLAPAHFMKRGAPVHRMLGRTARVMDTTAEAADMAVAADAADDSNSNNVDALNNIHAPRFLGPPLKCPPEAAAANNAPAVIDHVALVARQRAGGDWEWEAGGGDDGGFLPKALGVDAAKLAAAVDAALAPLGAWATALVLAKLGRDFAAFEEEWEAAARKARRWLGKQLQSQQSQGAGGLDADALVARAGEILASLA